MARTTSPPSSCSRHTALPATTSTRAWCGCLQAQAQPEDQAAVIGTLFMCRSLRMKAATALHCNGCCRPTGSKSCLQQQKTTLPHLQIKMHPRQQWHVQHHVAAWHSAEFTERTAFFAVYRRICALSGSYKARTAMKTAADCRSCLFLPLKASITVKPSSCCCNVTDSNHCHPACRSVRIFAHNGGHSREVYHTKRMQRVFATRFSGDGSYVFSGSDDMNVRIWKVIVVAHCSVLSSLPGHHSRAPGDS